MILFPSTAVGVRITAPPLPLLLFQICLILTDDGDIPWNRDTISWVGDYAFILLVVSFAEPIDAKDLDINQVSKALQNALPFNAR